MGKILHLTESEKMGYSQGRLMLVKDKDKVHIDIKDVEAIVVESLRISLTPSAIIYTSENHVPLIFCNKKHMPQVYCSDLFGHYQISKVIKEQIQWDKALKEKLWKEIIRIKIINQKELLETFNVESYYIKKLEKYIMNLDLCSNMDEVSNQEAISARIYFEKLFSKEFNRKNENNINAGLNYGYSLIRSYIGTVIVSKGLHPSLGIWHRSV